MTDRIRLLLVDDHAIVRAGVRSLLEEEPDMEVVGEAGDGAEAVAKANQLLPDVVLMDLSMPGMGGMEATQQIKHSMPCCQVLVLTMRDSEEYFFPILRAGASGYILKATGPQELVSAIRAVSSGQVFLSPAVAKVILGRCLEGGEKEGLGSLTEREREVLKLVAQGMTNREIAASLILSVKTVEKHRANLMGKLDLHGPAELIKFALKKGLIDGVASQRSL